MLRNILTANTWYKIKSMIAGLKNLWKWRKVIYYDRDWDYFFIYQILKTKLQFQADYIKKYGYHENASKDAKQMLECVDLIDKVQHEYYIDQAMKQKKWDMGELKIAEEKHDQARKQLFQTISDNIEKWWD